MKRWWYSLLVGGCLQAQTWTQIANFPSTSRDDGVGVVCNGTWYVGTGQRFGAGPANDFYVFNPLAANFSSITAFPEHPANTPAHSISTKCFMFLVVMLVAHKTICSNTQRRLGNG